MYINKSICISPQKTFTEFALDELVLSAENKLKVIEPAYEGIPLNTLRRMGKAVRMGVGAAMPLLNEFKNLDGIIIGTANGGMEDCIKFLNQIIEFNEGTLTPTNFVQSTTNAIAAQIALTAKNKNYNITHVHRGLAFENAMLDAQMQLMENPSYSILLGGIDEISTYNFNIENLGGWYKKEITSNADLYRSTSDGSIAGEGVAMFIVSNKKENAVAEISKIKTLHSDDMNDVIQQLQNFIEENGAPDLFITGENGDARFLTFYVNAENALKNIPLARYKHLCGEYPTSSSFAVWLAAHILEYQTAPVPILKSGNVPASINKVLIYNNYKALQHSFVIMQKT